MGPGKYQTKRNLGKLPHAGTIQNQNGSGHLELHGTMPRWLLNISEEEGPTTSLGKLCQCSFTNRFLCSWWLTELSVFVCACCLLSFHWTPLNRAWLHLLCTLSLKVHIPLVGDLQVAQSQFDFRKNFFTGRMVTHSNRHPREVDSAPSLLVCMCIQDYTTPGAKSAICTCWIS